MYRREVLLAPPAPLTTYKDLEYIRFTASFVQLRVAEPLRPMPLIVLAHGRPFELPPGLPSWFGPLVERVWATGQKQLSRLVPGGRLVVAASSGHYIQLDQPGLVIASIRRVVAAARAGRTRLP